MQRRFTLLLAVLVLVVAGLLPVAAMLAESVVVDGNVTLSVYQKLFVNPARYVAPFAHSLTLAALTTGIAATLGVPLGLLLGKTDLPLRRMFAVLLSIPLLVPPYILAVCWFDLLAPNGMFAGVMPSSISDVLSGWLFGLPGCVWVMVGALMPVVMILTLVYLRAVNPRLEEAARLITGWSHTLRQVTLPMIQPALVFAGMIVFLLAAGEVGVPMFLRYPVYPVETLTQFAAFYDFAAAAATAVPLLVITVLLLSLERRYLRERTYGLRPATPGKRMLLVRLRRWRLPALLGVSLLTVALVLLPLLALMVSSLSPFGYHEAWQKTADSLGRSMLLAGLGATFLTAIGFCCGYLIHRRALPWWRAVDTLTLLLFTLPGTVIGVGLIALWNHSATGLLYASSAMIILAYLAQYTALTSRISLATLANVPVSLEEAAQMTGASWLARMQSIVLPAALPGLLAAWMIAFIFCLRDLGASMLVYPAGRDTLPVRIFTLMANGAPNLISASCMILIAVSLLMIAILGLSFRALAHHR